MADAPTLTYTSADSGGVKPRSRGGIPRLQEAGLVVVIIVLGAVLSIYGYYDAAPGRPNTFLNYENLIDGVATPMSYYAIMAVGVTMVIITGGIDISVGSAMALSALAAAAALPYFDPAAPAWQVLPIAFAVPLGVGLLCGLVNGALIVALRVHPFIITLGTLSIYRGIANVTTRGVTQPSGRNVLPDAFTSFMWTEVFGLQVMPLAIMLAFVALGWVFLHLLVAGRETYAIGGNEEASRFSGLRVNAIKLRVYAIAGLAAGVAGLVSLGRFGTVSASTGTGYELTVIAAAVVGGASLSGGRGSALGALLGTLIIALIQNGIYILHLQEQYRLIITGSAIIIAVGLDRFSEYLRNRRLAGGH